MENIKLQLTGPEAIDHLKIYFPKNWEEKVLEGDEIISRALRLYNLSLLDSVNKYLRCTQLSDKYHVIIAALYLRVKKDSILIKIEKIDHEISQIICQTFALETSPNFSSRESNDLRLFYQTKQNELRKNRDELINDFPVFAVKTVQNKFDSSRG